MFGRIRQYSTTTATRRPARPQHLVPTPVRARMGRNFKAVGFRTAAAPSLPTTTADTIRSSGAVADKFDSDQAISLDHHAISGDDARSDVDEYDYDSDGDALVYHKSLLGREPASVEELVHHFRSEHYRDRHRNPKAPPSASSDFDYAGEYADYKYARGILETKGGECADLAAVGGGHKFMNTQMADGSKMIMKKMYDPYHNAHAGQPAFAGTQVSDELKTTFMDAACEVRDSSTHLSKKEELRLNSDCYERQRDHSSTWSEDWDDLPLPLAAMNVIVSLQRSAKTHLFGCETKQVRDDLPANPYSFPSCKAGADAAYALQLYQADPEPIAGKTPVAEYERPHFENELPLHVVRGDPYEHLHAYPTHSDKKTREVIICLQSLVSQRKEFERNRYYYPEECACGSGVVDGIRENLEWPCILEIYNQLRLVGEWTAEELCTAGLIGPEDEFGLNPDYLHAKLLWWKHKRGIEGLVAVIRYHMELTRALRSPLAKPFFMSEQEEDELNKDSIDRLCYLLYEPPALDVRAELQVFDALHATPVDYQYPAASLWRISKVAAPNETLPHDLFYDTDFSEQVEEAYASLLDYQDSYEPGTESHIQKEDWARPQLSVLLQVAKAELTKASTNDSDVSSTIYHSTNTSGDQTLVNGNHAGMTAANKKALYTLLEKFVAGSPAMQTHPPDLYISRTEQDHNKALIDAVLVGDRESYSPELDVPSNGVDVSKWKEIYVSPPGIATSSEMMAWNLDALDAVLHNDTSLPPPGLDISSARIEDNKEQLAAIDTDLRAAPPGIAVSPESMMRNTNALATIMSDSSTDDGSEDGGVLLDASCHDPVHHFDALHAKDRRDSVHDEEVQAENVVRTLRALLRPKNPAEIRLLKMINPDANDLEFVSRRRTEKEELLLSLIQQRSTSVNAWHM